MNFVCNPAAMFDVVAMRNALWWAGNNTVRLADCLFFPCRWFPISHSFLFVLCKLLLLAQQMTAHKNKLSLLGATSYIVGTMIGSG